MRTSRGRLVRNRLGTCRRRTRRPRSLHKKVRPPNPLTTVRAAAKIEGDNDQKGRIPVKVLVVIDMQNDFIDGPLGSLDAQAIVHRVVDKIAAHDGPLLATQDSHDPSYLDTQEGKRLPVPHCLLHSDGWQLAEPIRRAFEERAAHRTRRGIEPKVVRKTTFGSTLLAETLVELDRAQRIDEIVLVGLCTDICVISNAFLLKAFLPEVKITVDAACCAGVTRESHRTALAAMKACQIDIENEPTD